jgi:hypothetical protein
VEQLYFDEVELHEEVVEQLVTRVISAKLRRQS